MKYEITFRNLRGRPKKEKHKFVGTMKEARMNLNFFKDFTDIDRRTIKLKRVI